MIPNTIKQEQEISELLSRGYVQESGSNANGSYIKFSDGTMICYLNIIVTNQAIATQYGTTSLYFGTRTWTFPVAFIKEPNVSCGQFKWGTGGSWGATWDVTKTIATLIGYDMYSRASGTKTIISAIAIGKWK